VTTRRWHARSVILMDEAIAFIRVLEWFPLQFRVPHDGIEHAVRGIERGNMPDVSDLSIGEIDRNYREGETIVAYDFQCLLKPVGLALNAVDQHAENIFAIKSTHLEDVAGWIVISLAWIGRRKYLVARTTYGLQLLHATYGSVPAYCYT
jgi:hypothetical protein